MQYLLQIIYIKGKGKKGSTYMESQLVTAMSGFTTDFFDALQTTFTDGSVNMSKLDVSQSNANKSMLMREVREQNLHKIDSLLSKMIKGIVFNVIYQEGIKKQRRKNKTPLNIHKCFYKIELMLGMKARAKLQWAFFRTSKFYEEFDKRDESGKSLEKIRQASNTSINMNNIQLLLQKQSSFQANTNIQHKKNQTIKALNMIEELLLKKKEKIFFNILLQLYDFWQKKSYFVDYLFLLFNVQIRSTFLVLHNYSFRSKPLNPMLKTQKNYEVIQLLNNCNESQKQCLQVQKIKQTKPKFKKVYKLQRQQNISQLKSQLQTEKQDSEKKKPAPGLKFNRGLKNKLQINSNNKIEDRKNECPKISKNTEAIVKQSKRIKIATLKAMNIEINIQDTRVIKCIKFQQFNKSQKTYHISAHEFKQQVEDVQDSMFEVIQDLFSSNISKSKQKLIFSRRVHKIDSKRPLEFSNNNSRKSKSRQNSEKSKKSSAKSEQIQEFEELNYPSLKSYYFPQKQNYGKAQQIHSTKYIGSNKWNGLQKKRVSTQSGNTIRVIKSNQKLKSSEKLNPYFQQLKDKIARKTPERIIGSQKGGQKNIVSRSNSKTNKDQTKQHRKVDQLKNMVAYKCISPNPKQIKWSNQRYTSPEVPKQWNLYNKKEVYVYPEIANIGRQKRALQAPLQFNKLNSKVNKNNQ